MEYTINYIRESFTSVMCYFDRHRIILDRESKEPYLERFYLFLKDRDTFPFNIFLHRFLKSDPDDLHDHPWNYRTFILFGGYWEYTEEGKFWRGPLSYRFADATRFHRLELDKEIDYCWTLFMPGIKFRDWGFMTDDGWIPHNKYINNKKKIN